MWGAALDLLFNVVVERALLGAGARVLWLLQLGRVPLEEQLQRTGPCLCAGALAWLALLVAWRALPP
jgi:hypothetical protein